jgi:hypothetical protein
MTYFRLLIANVRLERSNARLMCKVIIQQIELEDIARDPGSKRAKEIIDKYKLKIEQRKEQDLAEQN